MPGSFAGFVTRAADTGHATDRIVFQGVAQWTDVFGGLSNGEIITMGASMISDSISAPNWGPDGDVFNFGLPRRDPDYGYVYMELTGGALHGGTAQGHTISAGDPIPDGVDLWGYFGRSTTGTFDFFQIFPVYYVRRADITADRTPTGHTRVIKSSGGGLLLKRSNDGEATWIDTTLGLSGSDPDLYIDSSGALMLAVNDGAGAVTIYTSRSDGLSWSGTVPTPTGYKNRLWRDNANPAGPMLLANCTVDTGTGNLQVYRSWDGGATWDAALGGAAGLPTSVPAQKPELRGGQGEVLLIYTASGGAVTVLRSRDDGGSWT